MILRRNKHLLRKPQRRNQRPRQTQKNQTEKRKWILSTERPQEIQMLNPLFYEGVVQSYNPGKKKHVILYDDGDMEVLQLDKEQWEVVSEGSEPSKRLKSSNVSPSKRMSAKEEKSRTPGSSRRNKNPSKKSRRKTTTKKNVKNSHSGISESNIGADASDYTERRATPDLSDSHPDTSPKVNEVNSDDSAEEQASPSEAAEEEPEAPTDPKESDREEKMDSFDRGATRDSNDEPLHVEATRSIRSLKF